VTIAVWIVLGVGGFLAHQRIDDVTAAGESTFLPKDAESTVAVDALQHDFSGGEEVPVILLFEREGGLSKKDLDEIGKLGRGLEALHILGASPVIAPFSADTDSAMSEIAPVAKGLGPVSKDGEAALVVLALDAADRGAIVEGVGTIRHYLDLHRPPGLRSYVTGPAGVAADLERVAESAGSTLLIATVSLVLILLLCVYRVPLLALLPLIGVGIAYAVATGIAYLLIESGLIVVNTEGTLLLLVLIFGVGTDYSLLLVHRYREELATGAPEREALIKAMRESGPAIAASGGTVVAAMLVLLLADLQSTHWLGPVLAIGVAVMLAAAFTLLPALLSVLGARAFWPGEAQGDREPHPLWARAADLVRRRARILVLGIVTVLVVLSLGNLVDHGTIGFGQGETRSTESGEGTAALSRHFPPGLNSPLAAVVSAAKADSVATGLAELDSVEAAEPVPAPDDSEKSVVVIVLDSNPYSDKAARAVADIRDELHRVDPGGLLTGIPAQNYDVEQTTTRDTRLIVPIVLVLIGLILALLLRSLVAPAFLIATVVGSFAATLGLITFAFAQLGGEGLSFNLIQMAFIFLVALGVDYNIFLMARARREAAIHGTREGILIALANTGGVITGAGLILAGTFATLTLLPLEALIQIGATVAIGVLLDTFVVRALLIPSITYLLGERTWWPGSVSSPGDEG
jgi:RND superfamily putative drug exporter